MDRNLQQLTGYLNGTGGLTATIKFEPIDHIRLRPNVIFDITDNRTVLHLGCTDHIELIEKKLTMGVYLHQQLSRVAKKCLGIDINKEAVEFLRRHGISNVIMRDITHPDIPEIRDGWWDYILLGEVLEHVDNPVAFLRAIISNYRDSIGAFVITVPNAFGLVHLGNALNRGIEAVNSDHRYWFTPYTLSKVLHEAGLAIEEMTMCLYENSVNALHSHRALLLQKPILLDSIVAVCRYAE